MKKILIVLLVLLVFCSLFYFLKNNSINILDKPSPQIENIKTQVSETTKTENNIQTNPNILQAGSIRLIEPFDGQKLISGSKISVQYEILGPIKFGSILISKDCNHTINLQENIGKHSFDCTLPKTIGNLKIGIQEMIYSPKVESKEANGNLTLIESNDLSVKDILYYPEQIFMDATPKKQNDGYVSFKVLYSDGTKNQVDTSLFDIHIKDESVASIFGKSNGGIVSLDGKKEGQTQMIVNYKGINKIIPIEVYPHDDSLQ